MATKSLPCSVTRSLAHSTLLILNFNSCIMHVNNNQIAQKGRPLCQNL